MASGCTASQGMQERTSTSGGSGGGRLVQQAGQAAWLACGVSNLLLLRLVRLPAGAVGVGGSDAGLWVTTAHKQAGPGAVEAACCGSGSRRRGAVWFRLAASTAGTVCAPSRRLGAAFAGARAPPRVGAVAGAVGCAVHLHSSRAWQGMARVLGVYFQR